MGPTQENGIRCAMFNLRRTARAVTQLYDDVLRPTGLRATQYSMLRVLQGRGPLLVTELGALMGMDRTTVTRNVGVLERLGYVAIAPGRDRRTRVVRLTGEGGTRVDAAHPYWEQAQAIVVDGMGEERWQSMRSELEALAGLGTEALRARTST